MVESDPTKRFSNRVENYVKYRPSYPPAVLTCLQQECGLVPTSVVADVGSGTGLLTELFLQNGNPVYAVEPNDEMCKAAETRLHPYPNFTSVTGTAAATTLPDHSVDFITAGQAFHWFDPQKAKEEFRRIIRAGGFVVLVWNERKHEGPPFMRAYEQLLSQYAIGYKDVKQRRSYAVLDDFFDGNLQHYAFDNFQLFDFEGFKGRLLSSSYAPLPGHSHYQPMLDQLRALFTRFEENGRVRFEYNTQVYLGPLQ